ncbi:energy transducer TonB [Erythrobacter sp.]|uniref:energy transducer TonB n=1 Tax=Erythrobacter sp. TaxID=1042 RepID=UPI001425CF41|nr:energy transducer TonB [Erythrobacter sp.]QIQ86749.1 MAG: energy transducer TonB [Erythrobacter sp.]
MNYVASRAKPNPAALAGALGVPTAIATLLVAGLAVTVVAPEFVPNPEATQIEDKPVLVEVPPEPARPERPVDPAATANRDNLILPPRPDRPVDSAFDFGEASPIESLPGAGEAIGDIGDIGPVGLPPGPSFADPVLAKPRGNPREWVTDADYRARWIREGMSGTARFTLAIEPSGKVGECTITRSSGHAELDAATCRLIERRARFEPARDAQGNRVAGSYSNAINWKIPD